MKILIARGIKIDIDRAHSKIVVRNHHEDPRYAPYCMRCSGLQRMQLVEPFYWRHKCGAEHDERAVLFCEVCDKSREYSGDASRKCIGCGHRWQSAECAALSADDRVALSCGYLQRAPCKCTAVRL